MTEVTRLDRGGWLLVSSDGLEARSTGKAEERAECCLLLTDVCNGGRSGWLSGLVKDLEGS